MKMPPTVWTQRSLTGLTLEQAFSHNEVEWAQAGDLVRWVPTPKSDKIVWRKISKSDQP